MEPSAAVTASVGVGVEDGARAVAVGRGASGVGDAALPQALNAAMINVADATLATTPPVANLMSIDPIWPLSAFLNGRHPSIRPHASTVFVHHAIVLNFTGRRRLVRQRRASPGVQGVTRGSPQWPEEGAYIFGQ